jgi:uncharacterized protein YeaO (DUF488 family)
MCFTVKRVYEPPNSTDGLRVLVDRLWPRGLSKSKADISLWFKDLAPSSELRRWFDHDRARWEDFKHRYFDELQGKAPEIDVLRDLCARGTVTLLYSAHDAEFNNAVALAEYLQAHTKTA